MFVYGWEEEGRGVILDISRIVSRAGHIRTSQVIRSKLTVSITVHDASHCTFKEGQAKMKLYKTRRQKLEDFCLFLNPGRRRNMHSYILIYAMGNSNSL